MDLLDNRIQELLRQARAADKVDRTRLELFEKMSTTPAWQEYVALLNAKIQMFADQLLMPSGSIDGCVAQEYVKGAMSGLVIARDIVGAIIAAKDQFRRMSAEEDDDEDMA